MRISPIRRRAPALLVCVAAVVSLTLPATARAHFSTYAYAVKECPAEYARQVDPITIVFDNHAWALRSLNHIEYHSGWSYESGSMQRFQSHGVCGDMHGQRASACGACTRFHVRVRRTYHADDVLGVTSVATPHHEDWVWYCGHAVDANGDNGSGFDQGRRRLTFLMGEGAGHYPKLRYWGNDRDFKQCDGDFAGSNGYVRFIGIPDWSH